MGVLTGQPFEVRLEGDPSLSGRPMDRVIDPLSKMGAFFLDERLAAAHLPLRMRGTHSGQAASMEKSRRQRPGEVRDSFGRALCVGHDFGGRTFGVPRSYGANASGERRAVFEREGTKVSVNGTATVRVPPHLKCRVIFRAPLFSWRPDCFCAQGEVDRARRRRQSHAHRIY